MHTVTYAIGDIHGRRDLLDTLLDLIDADATARGACAKIVFTGDYVDRGPQSRGVIERLMAGPRRPGDVFVPLRGNHDDLFIQAVTIGDGLPDWAWEMFWGTIGSYGWTRETLDRTDDRLHTHAAFLAGLPLTHDDGINLFVHAGIRPGVPLDRQTTHDLTWIREGFLDHAGALPRLIVHGHTIMGDRPVVTANRVSIDTGAYKSGILTAAVLDGGTPVFLQAIGEPDRTAFVREDMLVRQIHGFAVSPAMQDAYDAFLAGEIDAGMLEDRLNIALAA